VASFMHKTVVAYLLAIGSVWAGLIYKIISAAPSNHTGFALWVFYLLLLAAPVLVVLHRTHGRVVMLVVMASLLHAGLLLAIDKTNTLVEYGPWLKRGMPEQPRIIRQWLGR
jgi:hypothetical protein